MHNLQNHNDKPEPPDTQLLNTLHTKRLDLFLIINPHLFVRLYATMSRSLSEIPNS